MVLSLADPFCDSHCWLLVHVLLLLCCLILLVVFHLGITFSSSIWNSSPSRAGILRPSTTMSTRLLSKPLPTPRSYQDHYQRHVLPLSPSARPFPLCVSHASFPSLHCLHTFPLFIRLYVHGDEGMLLADPRSHCHSAFCCCVVVCVSQLTLPPLSDRVPIVVAVVFQLHLEGRTPW